MADLSGRRRKPGETEFVLNLGEPEMKDESMDFLNSRCDGAGNNDFIVRKSFALAPFFSQHADCDQTLSPRGLQGGT